MSEMKIFTTKISALSRLRYITCTSSLVSKDGAMTIAETLDEEIRKNIIYMKTYFSVNKGNVELFLKFFWEYMDEDETWSKSVKEFRNDWSYSKEMLDEMLKEILSV